MTDEIEVPIARLVDYLWPGNHAVACVWQQVSQDLIDNAADPIDPWDYAAAFCRERVRQQTAGQSVVISCSRAEAPMLQEMVPGWPDGEHLVVAMASTTRTEPQVEREMMPAIVVNRGGIHYPRMEDARGQLLPIARNFTTVAEAMRITGSVQELRDELPVNCARCGLWSFLTHARHVCPSDNRHAQAAPLRVTPVAAPQELLCPQRRTRTHHAHAWRDESVGSQIYWCRANDSDENNARRLDDYRHGRIGVGELTPDPQPTTWPVVVERPDGLGHDYVVPPPGAGIMHMHYPGRPPVDVSNMERIGQVRLGDQDVPVMAERQDTPNVRGPEPSMVWVDEMAECDVRVRLVTRSGPHYDVPGDVTANGDVEFQVPADITITDIAIGGMPVWPHNQTPHIFPITVPNSGTTMTINGMSPQTIESLRQMSRPPLGSRPPEAWKGLPREELNVGDEVMVTLPMKIWTAEDLASRRIETGILLDPARMIYLAPLGGIEEIRERG